jgi:HlyD family secretion protein
VVEYEERTLAFEVPGRIVELSVDEGSPLRPGELVGRLDDTLERAAREVAAAQAKVARSRVALTEAGSRPEDIRALKAAVRAAKSSEALAARTLEREQVLATKDIGRPADLDDAASTHASAVARRQELEQQLARARHGARPEEIDVAEAEAAAAETSVRASDERIARHVLHASHAGSVLEVHREEGEVVTTGAPVITMADVTRPYVDVFVPQADAGVAEIGRPAELRIDALDRALTGQVEYVGRRTEFTPKFLFSPRERPNLVLRVRVRVDDPDHLLRAGLPAFVTFGPAA